jgi:hypothetical protein
MDLCLDRFLDGSFVRVPGDGHCCWFHLFVSFHDQSLSFHVGDCDHDPGARGERLSADESPPNHDMVIS